MSNALGCAAAAVIGLSACGGAASAGTRPVTAAPQRFALGIDQLATAGFTVESPLHPVGAIEIAAGDAGLAHQLSTNGMQLAAAVQYVRDVDVSMANGPVEVISTVERFAGAAGAASEFTADVRALDAVPGAAPTSTGPLGDEAHADSVVRAAATGIRAVQITLEWRVNNLLNIIVLRGRYGGTRLDDALSLAQRQTATELAA